MQQLSLRYRFDWSEPVHVRAVRAVTRHQEVSGIWKVLRWLASWGLGIAIAAVVLLGLTGGGYILGVLPWLVVAVLARIAVNGGMAWLQGKQYPKKARGAMELWITDTAVGSSSPMTRVETDWSMIERVVETADFLLFFMNERFAQYLPKGLVAGADLETIRRIANEKTRYVQAST